MRLRGTSAALLHSLGSGQVSLDISVTPLQITYSWVDCRPHMRKHSVMPRMEEPRHGVAEEELPRSAWRKSSRASRSTHGHSASVCSSVSFSPIGNPNKCVRVAQCNLFQDSCRTREARGASQAQSERERREKRRTAEMPKCARPFVRLLQCIALKPAPPLPTNRVSALLSSLICGDWNRLVVVGLRHSRS